MGKKETILYLDENKTYSTSEIASIIGIHPNTVRLYEEWGLIHKPNRKKNGYREFTILHVKEFQLARKALSMEVLQNGLRKQIIDVLKLSSIGEYRKAIKKIEEYNNNVLIEITYAKEAIQIIHGFLDEAFGNLEVPTEGITYKRHEVSHILGITMDTLRNWEMNGLIKIKRKENRYRVYTTKDIARLKIIRTLRCANYSLSSILRMLNELDLTKDNHDIEYILSNPSEDETIISVCDKLIISLNQALVNGREIHRELQDMDRLYSRLEFNNKSL